MSQPARVYKKQRRETKVISRSKRELLYDHKFKTYRGRRSWAERRKRSRMEIKTLPNSQGRDKADGTPYRGSKEKRN